jgi:hypothetical protein
MRIVSFDGKIIDPIVINASGASVQFKRRERPWFARELQPGLVEVVEIKVDIASHPDELTKFKIALLGDH